LTPLVVNYDKLIICGDFNVNLLLQDNSSSALLNLTSSLGLSVVNTSVPTRFANNAKPSLLDIFITSDLTNVKHFDQMSFLSDHDLTLCIFDLDFNVISEPTVISYRDFKSINYSALFSDAIIFNWDYCWFLSTVDEKLNFIETHIRMLFDKHVPLRSLRIKCSSCPWLSGDVLLCIKNKNRLHTVWKRNPTSANWKAFKEARNKCTAEIRHAKHRFFQSKLDPNLNSKKLWQNIRQLSIHSGKKTQSASIDCNLLNNFFTASEVKPFDRNASILHEPPIKKFQFSAICEEDVCRCVMKIKSNAAGHDELPIKFIKLILPYIIGPVTHLLNHCFTTSRFPQSWKIATITPVAKKADAQLCSDFRPISILPCLSKVCEMLMSEQIMQFVSDNSLLSPLQSVLKKGHSCSTALVRIMEDVRSMFDSDMLVLLCLLDFSKAFDEVIHELLLLKLQNIYGFHDSAFKLMASYLTDCKE